MQYNLSELVNYINAEIINNSSNIPKWGFITDSRVNINNQWFVAFEGDKFNAHDYLEQAINNNSQGLIIHQDLSLEILTLCRENNIIVLKVQNTLAAYQQIANYYREKYLIETTVIAITGSNGKTTTKELLYSILSEDKLSHCTQANENNEIGVPKTILNTSINSKYLIIEFGMRGLGEIAELVNITQPDIVFITNIGSAHIERLGTRENIARAKAEIFASINKSLRVYISETNKNILNKYIESNSQHEYNYYSLANISEKQINITENTLQTVFKINTQEYIINSINTGILSNTIGVIELAKKLDIPENIIKAGVNNYQAGLGRGKIITDNNIIILDETYNASPESLEALINSIGEFSANYSKNLVLGYIAELGENIQPVQELLTKAQDKNINIYLVEGASIYNHQELTHLTNINLYKSKDDFIDYYKQLNNSEYIVFGFKGSRVSQLDYILDKLFLSKPL